MAKIMVGAITEFTKERQPQYLRLVHVVVYQPALMAIYKQMMTQAANMSMLNDDFLGVECI